MCVRPCVRASVRTCVWVFLNRDTKGRVDRGNEGNAFSLSLFPPPSLFPFFPPCLFPSLPFLSLSLPPSLPPSLSLSLILNHGNLQQGWTASRMGTEGQTLEHQLKLLSTALVCGAAPAAPTWGMSMCASR